MEELISREWQPLIFPSGKFPEEAYRFFTEPTETLYTLALAYPHLAPATAAPRAKTTSLAFASQARALSGPVGQRTYRAGHRSECVPPTPLLQRKLLKFQEDILRTDLARLYPIWLWARVTEDWSKVEADWPRISPMLQQRPNRFEEDCRNGYIAGSDCLLPDCATHRGHQRGPGGRWPSSARPSRNGSHSNSPHARRPDLASAQNALDLFPLALFDAGDRPFAARNAPAECTAGLMDGMSIIIARPGGWPGMWRP